MVGGVKGVVEHRPSSGPASGDLKDSREAMLSLCLSLAVASWAGCIVGDDRVIFRYTRERTSYGKIQSPMKQANSDGGNTLLDAPAHHQHPALHHHHHHHHHHYSQFSRFGSFQPPSIPPPPLPSSAAGRSPAYPFEAGARTWMNAHRHQTDRTEENRQITLPPDTDTVHSYRLPTIPIGVCCDPGRAHTHTYSGATPGRQVRTGLLLVLLAHTYWFIYSRVSHFTSAFNPE